MDLPHSQTNTDTALKCVCVCEVERFSVHLSVVVLVKVRVKSTAAQHTFVSCVEVKLKFWSQTEEEKGREEKMKVLTVLWSGESVLFYAAVTSCGNNRLYKATVWKWSCMWTCLKAPRCCNWSFLLTSDAPGQLFNTSEHMRLSSVCTERQTRQCVLPWHCNTHRDMMKTLLGCFYSLLTNGMLTDLKRSTCKLSCAAGSHNKNIIKKEWLF